MRVLVVDTYYPALLDRHYAAHPELAGASYDAQLRALLNLKFGTSDAYSRYLCRNGAVGADVIVNCEPLQRAWAQENTVRRGVEAIVGRAPGRLGWAAARAASSRVVAAQIADFEPDVIYLQDLAAITPVELRRQRKLGRLVVGQIASPLPDPEIVRLYDLILTSFPHYVERIRALGVASEYFPIAFDEDVLRALEESGIKSDPGSRRPHDAAFVGGVHPGVHGRGTAFLNEVCRRLPLEVWGYGGDALPPESPILGRHRGEAWGLDMYRVLARSKIALNRHIDVAEGYSNNMRLYEATGVGALLMTEASENLHEIFDPGVEVVSYDGLDDLVAKIEFYLANEDERVRIAAAGQARTLRDHTYETRIRELIGLLEARA